jgi:hypothetical protein
MSSARAALLEILEGVEAIDVDGAAKDKFRQLVGTVANTHGYDWIGRAGRVTFASRLLRMHVARPEIRDRLMAFYGISRAQAYRIIDYALSHE